MVMRRVMGGLILAQLHNELAKKYRMMVFEMPGFGRSPANTAS